MKTFDEIKACKRLLIGQVAPDGFNGEIHLPMWKGTIICSWGGGWEHVSVAPYKRRITPSLDDMCLIKDIFFKEEEAVIQIHPPKADYVNNVPNCLHLWRPIDQKLILPPSILVGLRKDQAQDSIKEELKKALLGNW